LSTPNLPAPPGQAPTFKFTDRLGREWDLTMTVAGANRIDRMEYDLDALKIEKVPSMLKPEKELFLSILHNTPLMLSMVWALVGPQVKKLQAAGSMASEMDEAEIDFAEGFNGQTIQTCRETFWSALADFFPDHQIVLSTLIKQYNKAQMKMNLAIEDLGPDLDNLTEAETAKALVKMRKKIQAATTSPETLDVQLGETSS
jgi:hypothetical protein